MLLRVWFHRFCRKKVVLMFLSRSTIFLSCFPNFYKFVVTEVVQAGINDQNLSGFTFSIKDRHRYVQYFLWPTYP